jgi:hypothetical protein
MNLTSLALVPYFVVFVTILGFIVFSTSVRAWLKIAAVVMTFWMASGIYFSLESYKGWPVTIEQVPYDEKMRLIWVDIYEPFEDRPGMIFVWLRPFDIEESDKEQMKLWEHLNPYAVFGFKPLYKLTPRSYSIPYEEPLAKELQQMQQLIKQGYKVQFIYSIPGGESPADRAGKRKGKASVGDESDGGDDMGVYVEPRPGIKLKAEVPGADLKK